MSAYILVVEDEVGIFKLIEFHLKQAGFEVVHCLSGEAAKTKIDERLPDLVLIDWMLPKLSGVELIRQLRSESRTKQLPIIMLTAKGEELDKEAGLNVGADDYVVKPFSPRELIARINALLRRVAPQKTSEIIYAGKLCLDPDVQQVTADGVAINFAPSEFRLLHFFMTHQDRTYSRMQLLDLVWGDHVFVEERTVDVHIRRLRRELEAVGLEGYIKTVRSLGYRFSIDAS